MGMFLVALVLAGVFQDVLLPPRSGDVIPLFNGSNLDNWNVPKRTADHFVVTGGVLQVRGRSGWLLTTHAYYDFVLAFEARGVGDDSAGGVFVRALPMPKGGLAYEVQVANGRRPSPVLRLHRDTQLIPMLNDPPGLLLNDDQWHDYRIACVGDTLRVLRDGNELLAVRGVSLNTGHIGLHAERGTVELRNIRIQKVADEQLALEGVSRPGDGVSLPRPIREVKPQCTREALQLGLEGEVWLECIVEADGRVERCQVIRRVSTDLDAQAVKAATQWRFEPGTRDGKPVPVLVTISMTFRLRQ